MARMPGVGLARGLDLAAPRLGAPPSSRQPAGTLRRKAVLRPPRRSADRGWRREPLACAAAAASAATLTLRRAAARRARGRRDLTCQAVPHDHDNGAAHADNLKLEAEICELRARMEQLEQQKAAPTEKVHDGHFASASSMGGEDATRRDRRTSRLSNYWKSDDWERPVETWSKPWDASQTWSQDNLNMTSMRVLLPTIIAFVVGLISYTPTCEALQDLLDVANTRKGPALLMLGTDQSQFMQNFLTVNGLLFAVLCGGTYDSLYAQQERLYHSLFLEVSEAKSLLEQACLICQGRPFYPKVINSIGDYIKNDLRRLDAEPSDLLANRPMDDPLEYILYTTSVGVPSIIYDTVRDLRQARGKRLGAMQRKLPPIHFTLLYVLGLLELFAFPFLGAGTASMAKGDAGVLWVQAIFFGAMCGAIVMTLQVIYEMWKPFGGAYTADSVLTKMVAGLEEELSFRKAMANFPEEGAATARDIADEMRGDRASWRNFGDW